MPAIFSLRFYRVILVGLITLLATHAPLEGAGLVGSPRPDAERVIVELLKRLDAMPNIKELSDTEFVRVVGDERRAVLQQLSSVAPAVFKDHTYAETLYPIARFFRRYDLAQKLMLQLRRYHDDPAIRDWAFTELIDIERQKLMSRTGRQLPDSTINVANGWQPADISAKYAFGHGNELFSPSKTDDKTQAKLRLAMNYEEEAARLAQMGNKNAAVYMIDLAAKHYADLHQTSDFAVGPMIWAARYLRDLGLPLAAIVRLLQILNRIENTDSAWKAIIHEDLGDTYLRLQHNNLAVEHFKKAIAAFRTAHNEESAHRVEVKLQEMTH